MLKLLRHPLFLLIFTLASALYSFSLYQTVERSSVGQENLTKEQQEMSQIEQKNSQLREQLERAETPFAKEKIVRDELLLQKNGERVIQLSEQQEYVPPPVLTEEPTTPWEEWKKVLF